jgi:hypothetical protein
VGRFHISCDRSDSGVVALFLIVESKVMTQSELNRQIAKQTGESITDIARHGFTILTELPQDDDDDDMAQLPQAVARTAAVA